LWGRKAETRPCKTVSKRGPKGPKIKKNTFFEKRTGEVVENKGNAYITSRKRTGKRSGEVVENTRGRKKLSGTNRRTNWAMLLKIQDSKKSRRR
jgi:hypothetical protein